MNPRVGHLLEVALGLPAEARPVLAKALPISHDDVDDPAVSDAWCAEIWRRQTELAAGATRAVSGAEAKTRLTAP